MYTVYLEICTNIWSTMFLDISGKRARQMWMKCVQQRGKPCGNMGNKCGNMEQHVEQVEKRWNNCRKNVDLNQTHGVSVKIYSWFHLWNSRLSTTWWANMGRSQLMERILSRIPDQKCDECVFKACQSWGVDHLFLHFQHYMFVWSSVSNGNIGIIMFIPTIIPKNI